MSFFARGRRSGASIHPIIAAVESLELRRMLCADHQFIESNANDLPAWVTDGIDLVQPVLPASSVVQTRNFVSAPVQNLVPQNAAPGQTNGTGNWGWWIVWRCVIDVLHTRRWTSDFEFIAWCTI